MYIIQWVEYTYIHTVNNCNIIILIYLHLEWPLTYRTCHMFIETVCLLHWLFQGNLQWMLKKPILAAAFFNDHLLLQFPKVVLLIILKWTCIIQLVCWKFEFLIFNFKKFNFLFLWYYIILRNSWTVRDTVYRTIS